MSSALTGVILCYLHALGRGNTSVCVCVCVSVCQCVHERALLWLVLLSVICTHQVSEAPAGFCSGRCADNGRTHGASRRNDAAERWVSIGGEPSRFTITIGSMRSTQTKSVHETESNTVITLLLQRSNASVRISHIYEVYSTDKPSETTDALNWTRVTSLTSVTRVFIRYSVSLWLLLFQTISWKF